MYYEKHAPQARFVPFFFVSQNAPQARLVYQKKCAAGQIFDKVLMGRLSY